MTFRSPDRSKEPEGFVLNDMARNVQKFMMTKTADSGASGKDSKVCKCRGSEKCTDDGFEVAFLLHALALSGYLAFQAFIAIRTECRLSM